jgi:hypothetical protein
MTLDRGPGWNWTVPSMFFRAQRVADFPPDAGPSSTSHSANSTFAQHPFGRDARAGAMGGLQRQARKLQAALECCDRKGTVCRQSLRRGPGLTIAQERV